MLHELAEERYFDYICSYAYTASEFSEELKSICRRKKTGDITLAREKYIFFALTNGVTILNKKTQLEMSFYFQEGGNYVHFVKRHLHNFIESDLNSKGLGKWFSNNSWIRKDEFEECLDIACMSGRIKRKDEGFLISKKELY